MKNPWNKWYNQTKAQAKYQFVDEIFDTNYTPGSVDDIHLFDLKKRFMYSVFTNTLLTEKGNPSSDNTKETTIPIPLIENL